jgi:hypothetical protein
LRLSAPIVAAESLLVEPGDEVADEESEEETSAEPDFSSAADSRTGDDAELSAEQLKAYLENLRPEDFGKFNP